MNKCGFKPMRKCDEDCKYFCTCTRNPQYEELKEGQKDGRCKMDQDNNRHIQ